VPADELPSTTGCRGSTPHRFFLFLVRAFQELNGRSAFLPNWHIELMLDLNSERPILAVLDA